MPCARRAGLAPLELVMSLPILLMVMGLIVVFGAAASWKIRTEVVARDAVWRARWSRQGGALPRPHDWPQSAGLAVRAGVPIGQLDDPALRLPVASGPLPGGVRVSGGLLSHLRGVRIGSAEITRRPPMLGKMGPYRLTVDGPLLDDRFQYGQMGYGSNRVRRMPRIYGMPESPGLSQAYAQAVVAIENAPFRGQLRPLDRDDEFLAYYGWAPDFHPRLSSFSSLDVMWVEQRRVRPLQERIKRLPRTMTQAFLGLYRSQLATDPPPPPHVQASLEAKIGALEQFLASLSAAPVAGVGPGGGGRHE